MNLVRLAILSFNPPLQEKWKNAGFDNEKIKIKTFPVTIDKQPNADWLICEAEVTLQDFPTLKDNKIIQIPEEPRKELDVSIENIANILAVSEMSQRSISSPHPCIGFRPKNQDELTWLNQTNGIEYNLKMIPSFQFTVENEMKNANFLQDRLGGIALMAESLSNSHVSGKLHELIRMLENAFATSSKPLATLLSKFLKDSPFQFTDKEIEYMVKSLRDQSTHADTNKPIVVESDIRPYIYKMEEIAYDVLFNKANWHTPDIKRRDILKPKAGVRGNGTAFTYQHNDGFAHIVQMFDPFGAFPFNLSGMLTHNNTKFWFKKAGKEELTTETYPFHVEPTKESPS